MNIVNSLGAGEMVYVLVNGVRNSVSDTFHEK